jgi:uncharacterized protein
MPPVDEMNNTKLLSMLLGTAGIIILILLLQNYSVQYESLLSQKAGALSLGAIFLTGLITGGLTCLAVQGGLLASTIARRHEEKLAGKLEHSGNALPILTFLTSKLIAYSILGALLGWLGSLFELSLSAQVIMQFVVAIFMVGLAMNMLNVHPLFRYFVIQPPKFIMKMVRKTSKRGDLFAPALLGAFTVCIPCGTTQAMMALSIGSGNPLMGAVILGTFILGTSPLFFTMGYFAAKLGDAFQTKFTRIAAGALIVLALYNISGAIALSGSLGTEKQEVLSESSVIEEKTIEFQQTAYVPDTLEVSAGSRVKLSLVNKAGGGCIQAFTIPKLGLKKIVRIGSTETIEFTAPNKPGTLDFMCSMGMFRGTIRVV